MPSRKLAEAIAEEWLAQGEKVKPETLPLTRLANTAIDVVAKRRAAIVGDILKYAGTDLLCYRADHPPVLIQDRPRHHAARQHGTLHPARFPVTIRHMQ